MFGILKKDSKKKTDNDKRPIRVIRTSENSWQIVYADE